MPPKKVILKPLKRPVSARLDEQGGMVQNSRTRLPVTSPVKEETVSETLPIVQAVIEDAKIIEPEKIVEIIQCDPVNEIKVVETPLDPIPDPIIEKILVETPPPRKPDVPLKPKEPIVSETIYSSNKPEMPLWRNVLKKTDYPSVKVESQPIIPPERIEKSDVAPISDVIPVKSEPIQIVAVKKKPPLPTRKPSVPFKAEPLIEKKILPNPKWPSRNLTELNQEDESNHLDCEISEPSTPTTDLLVKPRNLRFSERSEELQLVEPKISIPVKRDDTEMKEVSPLNRVDSFPKSRGMALPSTPPWKKQPWPTPLVEEKTAISLGTSPPVKSEIAMWENRQVSGTKQFPTKDEPKKHFEEQLRNKFAQRSVPSSPISSPISPVEKKEVLQDTKVDFEKPHHFVDLSKKLLANQAMKSNRPMSSVEEMRLKLEEMSTLQRNSNVMGHVDKQTTDTSKSTIMTGFTPGMTAGLTRKKVLASVDSDPDCKLASKLVAEVEMIVPKENLKRKEKKEEVVVVKKPATMEMKKKVIGSNILGSDQNVEKRAILTEEVRKFKGLGAYDNINFLANMMNPYFGDESDKKKKGGKFLNLFYKKEEKRDEKSENVEIKSEDSDKPFDREYRGWVLNFMSIFSVPEILDGFMTHLKKESNVEPLEFLVAVHKLKRDTHLQTVQQFYQIIDQFVKPGSNKEINVSGGVRSQLLASIEGQSTKKPWRLELLPVDYFETCLKQTYSDLKGDSWPRFILSLRGYEIICKHAHNPLVISKEPASAVQFKLQKAFFGTNVDDVDEKHFTDVANKLSYPRLLSHTFLSIENLKVRQDRKELDQRRLSIMMENLSKRKLKAKILIMKKQNSVKQGLKRFLNPVFQTVANDNETFQTALLLGGWILNWDESEICVPRTCVLGSLLLSTNLDGGTLVSMDDTKVNKLAELICRWNVGYSYSLSGKGSGFSGNCQDFIDEILNLLDIKLQIPPIFDEFIQMIKQTGMSELQFKPNNEFRQKFNLDEIITFDTHQQIDEFVVSLMNVDKKFKTIHPHEYAFLRSFDVSWWLRFANIKAEMKKKNILLTDSIKDIASRSHDQIEKLNDLYKTCRTLQRELSLMITELKSCSCTNCPFGDPAVQEGTIQ